MEHLLTQPAPAPGAPADPTPAGPAPTPNPAAPPTPQPAPAQPAPFDPASLTPEARAYLKSQIDAADMKARTTTRDNAAADARKQLAADVAKALGLTEAPADPAKLTEQLTASQTATRQAAVELAVWKAAATAGGNAELLLDSRAFVDTISKLDPTAGDFSTKLTEAITAAVTSNDRFKVAGPAPAQQPPSRFPGGADGGPRPGTSVPQLTEQDLRRMTPEQIVDARAKGQLADLMRGT
jgi:hypothetical protein